MKLRRALAGLALFGGALLLGVSLGCGDPVHIETRLGMGVPQSRPLWAPDGSQIVFSRHYQGMYVVDIVGTRLRTIPRNVPTEESFVPREFSPSLSPDGSRVAYVAILEGDNPEIMSVAMSSTDGRWLPTILRNLGIPVPDGVDERRLTHLGRGYVQFPVVDRAPAWSPDGNKIAFVSDDQLTLMNADGSGKQVFLTMGLGLPPVWSPDGRWIAFLGLKRNEFFPVILYVVRPDGSELTELAEVASMPTWSPDGGRIAFFRLEEKAVALKTLDIDSGEERELLSMVRGDLPSWEHAVLYTTLSWSPDDSALLFASERVVSVEDGRVLADVKRGWAEWSPDGSRIAVQRLHLGSSGYKFQGFQEVLYTMARDGTEKRVLVRGTDKVLVAEHGEWRDVSHGIAACAQGYVVPSPRRNPGLVEDCETLMRVRDKLAGEAYLLAGEAYLNWGAAFRIADWQGVTVAGDPPRVWRLELHRANSPPLTGFLPPELGRLSKLEELLIAQHELTGGIPAELGNLTELRTLVLLDTQLEGSIPPELGNLAKLERLDLLGNRLSGSIPPELGNLTALDWLRLTGNRLSGCVPASLYDRNRHMTAFTTDWLLRCK